MNGFRNIKKNKMDKDLKDFLEEIANISGNEDLFRRLENKENPPDEILRSACLALNNMLKIIRLKAIILIEKQ